MFFLSDTPSSTDTSPLSQYVLNMYVRAYRRKSIGCFVSTITGLCDGELELELDWKGGYLVIVRPRLMRLAEVRVMHAPLTTFRTWSFSGGSSLPGLITLPELWTSRVLIFGVSTLVLDFVLFEYE
jgi:hypothetical protein